MGKTASESNISSILDKTADVIQLYGWRSGGGWWEGGIVNGKLCLEGALQLVLGIPHANGRSQNHFELTTHPAYQFLQTYVDTLRPLHHWNDHYVANQKDILTVLRHAATQARCLEKDIEKEKRRKARKLSIKTIAFWMNTEMDEFEKSIQTSTLEKEKELIDA